MSSTASKLVSTMPRDGDGVDGVHCLVGSPRPRRRCRRPAPRPGDAAAPGRRRSPGAPTPMPVAGDRPPAPAQPMLASGTDHESIIGRWGIEARRVVTLEPDAGPGERLRRRLPGRPERPVAAQVGQHANYAYSFGLALGVGGGSSRPPPPTAPRPGTPTSASGPPVSASFLLANWKHLAVSFTPGLDVVFFMPSSKGSKSYRAQRARGLIEGELHLGMIGLPQASVGPVQRPRGQRSCSPPRTRSTGASRRTPPPASGRSASPAHSRSGTSSRGPSCATTSRRRGPQPGRPPVHARRQQTAARRDQDLVERGEILDAVGMARVVRRMAFEIFERVGARGLLRGHPHRRGVPGRAHGAAAGRGRRRPAHPGRGGHHPVPGRRVPGPAQARGRRHRAARQHRRADGGAGGRRAVHRAHGAGGDGRAGGLRPPAGGAAGRAWSTGAGASCPSSPTTWGCGCRPRPTSRCG